MKIFPSLISADILHLGDVIQHLESHCDGFHIDVMDFHFVPNLTWGPQFVNAIVKATEKPIHVHLMVDQPHNWIPVLYLREKDYFIFHVESIEGDQDCVELINEVKDQGWKVGIAISPETPVEMIFPFLAMIDKVLIMSVNPGFSGQKFMPDVLEKARQLVQKRGELNLEFVIGLDGGVNFENISLVREGGVDQVAAASAIFEADDKVGAIDSLREG